MAKKPMPEMGTHEWYDTVGNVGARLNWLRAAVLGANDGIVATAGILIGVAGANGDANALLTAGVAGLSAGAMSMAVGEYVSVSAQKDTEKGMLDLERRELAEIPEQEMAELAGIFEELGVNRETAMKAAREVHDKDPLHAHAQLEHQLDPNELTNPVEAALASAAAFTLGGLIPFLTILLVPHSMAVWATVVAVAISLLLTGAVSAKVGRCPMGPAIARNVIGGLLAMGITYGIGHLFGASIE